MSAPIERVSGIYPLADDDPRWRHDPTRVVDAALEAGATVIQLRLKLTNDRQALELSRWAASRTRAAGALLILNDRFDLADLAGADGVHLGQDDLPPELIPPKQRERLLVGRSTHTLEQVKESRDRPVDYIAFGPVFSTRSKASAEPPRGLDLLREAVATAGRPVVAIGGITAATVRAVFSVGATAAAVISAVANATDPIGEIRLLRQLAGNLPPPQG